jgi:hypothetical protein
VLEKLKAGDTLLLVRSNQVEGFYNVISLASRLQGWVNKTLVRIMQGDVAPDWNVANLTTTNAVVMFGF